MMILRTISILAQADAEFSYASFFFRCLLAIALLVGGFFAVTWVRRWAKHDDSASGAIGFTLSDLRQLHKAGQMTDEEFERAKTKMVAATKAAIERKAAGQNQQPRGQRLDGLL
jgi:hypothetical protein